MAKRKRIPMAGGKPPISMEEYYDQEAKQWKIVYDSYLHNGFSSDNAFKLLLKHVDASIVEKCLVNKRS